MGENIGIATLAMTQGISASMFFLPKITDVRKASVRDEEALEDIRVGEAAAVVLTFGVGVMCSALTRSSLPAMISLCTALLIVGLYETVLRKEGTN